MKNTKTERRCFSGGRVYVTNDGFIGRPRLGKLSGALQAFSVSRILPYLEAQGQPFIHGCFNWMMNQIFVEKIGWKSPFPSIYKRVGLGVPGMN